MKKLLIISAIVYGLVGTFGLAEYLLLGNMICRHPEDIKKWANEGDPIAYGWIKGANAACPGMF